jgi:hypothetical protein
MVKGLAQPCAECGGLGEVQCCEGLQAQPEPPAQSVPDQSGDHLVGRIFNPASRGPD